MGTDDASSADMRRVFTHPDADPLALDDETVERLLAGELPPAEAPPGYAGVAELLAATAAPPTPEELAGRAAALAQLRVVTRTPPVTRAWRAGRRARRRRAGLAVVVVVGALTAGSAAAATGNLPGPVADAARSILTTVAGGGAEPAPPTTPGRQSDPAARAPAPGGASTAQGPGPADADSPGPVGTGTAAGPAKEGLCRAFMAGQGDDRGKKLDAAAFQALAEAAGGADRIPAYCQGIEPGPDPPKKPRQSAPPDDQEQGPVPGGPPTDTGGGAQGQGTPPDSTGSSSR